MLKTEFIVQDILSKLYQHAYASGRLPSQRELARQYSVSRFTVQSALAELEQMGALIAKPGSGVFVPKGLEENPLVYNSMTRVPYDHINSEVLSLVTRYPNYVEQQIFQIGENDLLWDFKRLRSLDFMPTQIEHSTMPQQLFSSLEKDVLEGSIQAYVEKCGYSISHFMTRYEPSVLSRQDAEILRVKRHTPAMHIESRGVLSDGRVFEHTSIVALDYAVSYIQPFNREVHRMRMEMHNA